MVWIALYVCVHACVRACAYTRVCLCLCLCLYLCLDLCAHVHVCTCACVPSNASRNPWAMVEPSCPKMSTAPIDHIPQPGVVFKQDAAMQHRISELAVRFGQW